MNIRLVAKYLGILALLIGAVMLFSLFWASPQIGVHTDPDLSIDSDSWEYRGIIGLALSMLISFAVGGGLYAYGRSTQAKLFRKEAMAVVGLSWVLATFLGALPYVLSGTARGPSIRTFTEPVQPICAASVVESPSVDQGRLRDETDSSNHTVLVVQPTYLFWTSWKNVEVSCEEFAVLDQVANSNARGINRASLIDGAQVADAPAIFKRLKQHEGLKHWLIGPGDEPYAQSDRASRYRLRWVPMGLIDSMFEAQSGFSTTGATVLCDLEDPVLVPHCILFWRASTHFLGGLGIIALFVVVLGQGSAGKSLMRNETPGPAQDSHAARIQHTAWLFAATYTGLNLALAVILFFLGMSVFDAICHAFATMATGGFSTYNASLGHFVKEGTNGIAIEYTVIVFMLLAGANFMLLFLCFTGNPLALLRDLEFRTYIGIITAFTAVIFFMGYRAGDADFDTIEHGFRNGLFQVISIITTTGYGTADFDRWNHFGRAALLALMFVGGCAGSTGGGLKVVRYILLVKILGLEIERGYQPKVVRLLKMDGKPLEDQNLRHSIVVYFGLVFALFVFGFLITMFCEPDATWGVDPSNKVIDSASAVASTLNNIGPGLGIVGATQNYASFSPLTKSLFIWLMMLGRLEIFPILVLFAPGFWREQ